MHTEAGIVASRREGKKTMYSINRKMLEKMNNRMREMLEQSASPKAAAEKK